MPSFIGSEAGHCACVPVHSASFSHVAKLAERHLAPADMKLHPGTRRYVLVKPSNSSIRGTIPHAIYQKGWVNSESARLYLVWVSHCPFTVPSLVYIQI